MISGWEFFRLRLYDQPVDAMMHLDWDLAQDNLGSTCNWDILGSESRTTMIDQLWLIFTVLGGAGEGAWG